MTWKCECGGEIEWQFAEPDVGLFGEGNYCVDCGEIPDEDDNPAIDPNEYIPDVERIQV